MNNDVISEWVHLAYPETVRIAEVYGFSGSQGMVNLEGIRFMPKQGAGRDSKTLLIFMHPATTLQLLPVPRALAARGAHVLCASSRYAKNDTSLILEKVLLDLGCYIRHAREVWGYEKVVLAGWSGGGSLALYYQSQAENPTVTETPAGDPLDLSQAGLLPADGVIFHAAHQSRAIMLSEFIDPSVLDESNPDLRDPELDIYDPRNPNQPPYSADYIQRYRAAQLARMRRRTAWVKQMLAQLRDIPGEADRGFITYRTMADLRFRDPQIDANDRRPNWCYMGEPSLANTAPAGLGRFSTLRSWLSQWSLEDSNALGVPCARSITVPLLAIENSADDAVPQQDTHLVYEAAGSRDKTLHIIRDATHYYQGQPELLTEAVDVTLNWLVQRGMGI
ncbi:alpha/beta hydrolase [Pseudomonas fluorescens]|nr:alpha/beta hydrolase [Pseudomonas fluorescens]